MVKQKIISTYFSIRLIIIISCNFIYNREDLYL